MKTVNRMTRPFVLAAMALAMLLSLCQSALAFSDTGSDRNKEAIRALQEAGIAQGDSTGKFNPGGHLTYASGISLLVKAFDLNIDHIRFIKQPLASDHYPNARDDAWYSDALVIAAYSGLDIPQDMRPEAVMTREQFAHHLFQAISSQGEFAYTEQYIVIADQQDIANAYSNSIQKLLITGVADLNKQQQFRPQEAISRGEAAGWLHRAVLFVRKALEQQEPAEAPDASPLYELTLTTTPVNEQVNAVTVRAQAPHPGYGIRIASIAFEGTQAIIHTETVYPDPDRMYPQVITEVQATVYIGSEFEPVLADPSGGMGSASHAQDDPVSASHPGL